MTNYRPTITIAIGTPHVSDGPGYLTDDQWLSFRDTLKHEAHILAESGTLHFRGEGIGQYVSGGTTYEELSYSVTFTLDDGISLDQIRRWLSDLARRYRQECIALTIGATEFVEPPLCDNCDNCGSPLVVVRSREGRFCSSECAEAFELS